MLLMGLMPESMYSIVSLSPLDDQVAATLSLMWLWLLRTGWLVHDPNYGLLMGRYWGYWWQRHDLTVVNIQTPVRGRPCMCFVLQLVHHHPAHNTHVHLPCAQCQLRHQPTLIYISSACPAVSASQFVTRLQCCPVTQQHFHPTVTTIDTQWLSCPTSPAGPFSLLWVKKYRLCACS